MNNKNLVCHLSSVFAGNLFTSLLAGVFSFALSFSLLKKPGNEALAGMVASIPLLFATIARPLIGDLLDRFNNSKYFYIGAILSLGLSYLLIYYMLAHGIISSLLVVPLVILNLASQLILISTFLIVESLSTRSKDLALKARSYMNAIITISGILSPALGGIIVDMISLEQLVVFNSFSIIIALLTVYSRIFFTKTPDGPKKAPGTSDNGNNWKETAFYLMKKKGITFMALLFNLAFAALFFSILPLVRAWNIDGKFVGTLYSILAIGSLAGNLLVPFVRFLRDIVSKAPMFLIAFTSMQISLVAIAGNKIVLSILLLSIGFFVAILNLAIMNEIIAKADESIRGKVSGSFISICQASVPLGQLAAGMLLQAGCKSNTILLAISMIPIIHYILTKLVFYVRFLNLGLPAKFKKQHAMNES